jgi:cytochrome P450
VTTAQCPAAQLAANFDFTDPRVRQDPPAVWAELRKGPPVWAEGHGGYWVVTRHEDVKAVVDNPGAFCSKLGTPFPPTGFPLPLPPSEADPPEHAHWRRLTAPFFTTKALARFEDTIREVARARLAGFVGRGEADFARDLAIHVPANVIAAIMGFPRSDAAWFAEITDRMLATAERPEQAEENAAIGAEVMAYLAGHLEDRRHNRRDDLLSDLAHGEVGGRPVTQEEALGVAFFFLIAGHETTVGGITSLLWRLGLNPDQRARLVQDRSLLRGAIEEGLRIDSPVLHLSRVVVEDIEFSGARMKAGDRVMVIYAAANRDEEVFPEADRFQLDRANNSRHVAFSTGIHKCQGAALARLEMRITIEEVLDAIPDYEIITDGVTMRSVQGVQSVSALPVTFTPTSLSAG